MKKLLTLALVGFLSTGLYACRFPGPAATPTATGTSVAANAALASVLRGTVDFSSLRSSQAVPGDITNQATIALIDAISGETRTSTITDATGNFTLSMPGFNPVLNGTYVLEATKGLFAQLPGNVAPRFRTLVQYTASGWKSLTSATAGGASAINAHTTAVAIVSALDPIGLPPGNAMGKVNPTPPGSLNASPAFPTHPDAELNALATDIVNTLSQDQDPVASTNAVKPTLMGMTPTTAAVAQPITLTGTGFVAGGTTVKVGAATIPGSNVLLVTKSQIIFTIPAGITTGNVTVTTARGGVSNGIPLSIPNSAAVSVAAISPNPARPNASVTVTGTGFSTTPAANTITVNGTSVTPDFANQTSLVFRVPSSAVSGNVTVTVGGQTSNQYYLTVESLTTPQITSLFPNVLPTKAVLAIKGQNFGPDGSVLVGDYQAKIISWSPNIIRVEVPWYVPPGSAVVTVFAPLGITTQNVTVLEAGTISPWAKVTDLPGDVGGLGVHAYVGGEKLWVWGGNGSTKVYYMNLNADGSFKDAAWTAAPFSLPEGTYQDDNPNSRTQIKNRIYYTVTNQLTASNSNHVNFASLDPYTGDITGFAYDPINDLPPTWVGKDLGLIAGDKYVYIMGHGVSCSGNGVNCNGNPVGTMQARILESGNIGQWEIGPNQPQTYGEDGAPFIIGDSLFQVGGTAGVSMQCVINENGQMSSWATMSVPLIPNGELLSTQVMKIGHYYYLFNMWSSQRSFRGAIVDDLVPKPAVELLANTPLSQGVACGIGHVDVQVGKHLYLISTHSGGYGGTQNVVRGTIQ